MAFTSAFTGAQIDAALAAALNGAAKTYAVYNHVAPATLKSYNLSSITDNATGEFTPNFTNVFSDALWLLAGACDEPNDNSSITLLAIDSATKTVGSGKVRTNLSSTGAVDNPNSESLMTGDLA